MDLVVGGTGHLGRRVVRSLVGRGRTVGVLLRPGADVGELGHVDVELYDGDLRDPASVDAACLEAETVVVTANAVTPRDRESEDEVSANLAYLFEACQREQVRHVVLVSPPAGPFDREAPHTRGRRDAEARLGRDGLPHTVVRLAPLTEFWLAMAGVESLAHGGGSPARARALLGEAVRDCRASTEASGVLWSMGDPTVQLPFLAVDDAAAAVAELTTGPPRELVEVAGPEARDWRSVATAVAGRLDRRVRLDTIATADLRARSGFVRRHLGRPVPGAGLLGFVRATAAARMPVRTDPHLPAPRRSVEDVLADAPDLLTPGRDARG